MLWYSIVTEDFRKNHIDSFHKNVYLCGPPPMHDSLEEILSKLQIDKKSIVKEEF